MNLERNFFEIGISRHAPKVEKPNEVMDVSSQEIDPESSEQEIEQRTRFILENLDQAPAGTVMAFEPSNVKRAEQTRGLFVSEIKELLGDREDIEVLEIGVDQAAANQAIDKIRSEPEKKFIISDLRDTWLIGFRDDDKFLPEVNEWKARLKGDENLLGKVWAAHEDEIVGLAKELEAKGININLEEIKPNKFQITPEERALRFVKWIQGMKKIGRLHFPDRPLILEGISHNLVSDYATLALMGEDISVESINRVFGGELRKPFERSSLVFKENGDVDIQYRDLHKEYSSDEFEEIVKDLKMKAEKRKEEWNHSEI